MLITVIVKNNVKVASTRICIKHWFTVAIYMNNKFTVASSDKDKLDVNWD
jgi:hypothetical protein